MSDPKRVPLQSLESLESLGAPKKDKKGEKDKRLAPSFRFTLTLPESNEKACPEFNYAELLKSAEKKRRKDHKKGDENATNGLDPFDEDDDDKVREIAKRFEAKYGTATVARRKKHNKFDDYADAGAGYDESDSFIDNTDAYDEIVPEEVTTAHGGFYINCGALEFKTAEGNSLLHNNNNNNEDDSSESSEEEPEEAESPKRSSKRTLSTSDEDAMEEVGGDHPQKKAKMDENMEKKNHDVMKKQKKQELDLLNRRKGTVVRDLLKEKREGIDGDGIEEQDEKKRSEKSESHKTKPSLEKKFDIKRFEKKSSSNGLDIKKLDLNKLGGKDRNIDDAIESVVNAARVEDESSRDTTDSGKSRGVVGSDSDCDDVDKEESPLPESLTEDMKEIVSRLKLHAENSKEGKTKFFNGPVNSGLFSLEKKLRHMYPSGVRMQTYAHLAHFLPCSKTTLVNRAKKLYLQDVEDRVKAPIERLKTAINKVMPSVMERYTRDCQRVADEKGIEGSPTDGESSDGEDSGNKTMEKTKIPRRRFPWNDETKKLVCEISSARRQYFEVLRPRKESVEAFVGAFLDTKVRPLWPPGWVRLQTLLKYSNPQPAVKRKPKKPKEASVSATNSLGPVGTTISNSTVKVDSHSINSVTANQERVKTPTNFSKTSAVAENPLNFSVTNQGTKSNEVNVMQSSNFDRKQPSKHKDKNRESPVTSQYSSVSGNPANSSVAKISVVPTSQLMAPKSKSSAGHTDKFNPMDLTSSSLSITPVNDFHKSNEINESKKDKQDMVSITPYSESVLHDFIISIPPNLSVPFAQSSREMSYPTTTQSQPGYPSSDQSAPVPPVSKPLPLKNRILQDSLEAKGDKRIDDKDSTDAHKTDKKDKKEKRSAESKHRSHESKRRRKELKGQEMVDSVTVNKVDPPFPSPLPAQPLLSREEQEKRLNEETMAATNFLSQIINDDLPRPMTDKRKENTATVLDEATGKIVQPTEQENDVQMVMRSLKELQELQEMKYSPSHSPVNTIQKPSKSSTNMQYVGYQEDYQRLYHKKDDKLRANKKEDAQW